MKNNKIYSLIIAAFLLLMLGCSEDFLDKKPIAIDTEETYYTTFDRLDMTATAAYGMLVTRDIENFYFIAFGSACDDIESGGNNMSDWPQWHNIDRLIHTPGEARIFIEPWSYWYKGIRMTNEFLSRVDAVKILDPDTINNPYAQRVGEMKYMRAFYHFLLLQSFGGVPVVDYVVDPSQFATPRNSVAEVLHFIESELETAIPDMMQKSQLGASNYGRASKGAAQALLAKAYLYESSYARNYPGDYRFEGCEEKWALAQQYAEAVMTSGQYSLFGINGETYKSWRMAPNPNPDDASDTSRNIKGGCPAYRYLFTKDADNCSESVFEAQNVNDSRGYTLTRGSYFTTYTTVRFYITPSGGESTTGGWSFNLPTQYLIDAFGNNDVRETGLNSAPAAPEADPRFVVNIGRPGDTILVGTNPPQWFEMSFSNLPTNTISRKYECGYWEFWSQTSDRDGKGPMNLRYIRYADVVLMAAEAAYMQGQTATALNYVNLVRERARMSGTTGYPQALTTVSFEDIVHERRLELATEGHRFFDLVRWGLGTTFLDNQYLASMGEGFATNYVPGKHEFFPLPASEIQLTDNALVQYEGWNQ